jgi:hypothetical protein
MVAASLLSAFRIVGYTKKWVLTDSNDFVVMQDRDIVERHAAGQHFTQADYRAVLGDAWVCTQSKQTRHPRDGS